MISELLRLRAENAAQLAEIKRLNAQLEMVEAVLCAYDARTSRDRLDEIARILEEPNIMVEKP